jgi:hypothetical protein
MRGSLLQCSYVFFGHFGPLKGEIAHSNSCKT